MGKLTLMLTMNVIHENSTLQYFQFNIVNIYPGDQNLCTEGIFITSEHFCQTPICCGKCGKVQ